jgi:hypothetical protein
MDTSFGRTAAVRLTVIRGYDAALWHFGRRARRRSGGRERRGKSAVQVADVCMVDRTGLVELRIKLPRPQHLDTADPERTADERPVRFDETQDSVDGDMDTNGRLDDLDLLQHSVHQFGAVAGADEELLCSCAEDTALDFELWTPLVRIDDPDAGRGHVAVPGSGGVWG